MTNITRRTTLAGLIGTGLAPMLITGARAQSQGVTDDTILLGQPLAYSGPASAYGVLGEVHKAYFKKINDAGGINGRKIEFETADDGYNPSKTVQAVRRMVEQDEVFAVFGTAGTAVSLAVQQYLASKEVPHVFAYSGTPRLTDGDTAMWSTGWLPSAIFEGSVYGKYVADNIPDAKVGVLYQNDDYGKDILTGIRLGLGDKADEIIVRTASYEVSDPTVDPQVLDLFSSGANTFMSAITSKAASQAIRKTAEIGWPGERIIPFGSASIGAVLEPAGLDSAKGLITSRFLKDVNEPKWKNDEGMQEFLKFIEDYAPGANPNNLLVILGYCVSQTLEIALHNCGDDLTRENFLKQSMTFDNVPLGMLLPGVTLNATPEKRSPIKSLQMARFDGTWNLFGEPISAL